MALGKQVLGAVPVATGLGALGCGVERGWCRVDGDAKCCDVIYPQEPTYLEKWVVKSINVGENTILVLQTTM